MNTGQMLKDDFQNITGNLNLSRNFRSHFKWLSFVMIKKPDSRSFEKKTKKDGLINGIETPNAICIEISSEKINMLLEQRLICAADIRCLDTNSKQCLKKLCLKTCLYSTPPYTSVPQLPGDSNFAGSTLQMEEL